MTFIDDLWDRLQRAFQQREAEEPAWCEEEEELWQEAHLGELLTVKELLDMQKGAPHDQGPRQVP